MPLTSGYVEIPMRLITRLCLQDDGQDMVEYTLILAFIALASAAALIGMNGSMSTIWSIINSRLTAAST
jgi:Flp pilus assembly pilin Flp